MRRSASPQSAWRNCEDADMQSARNRSARTDSRSTWPSSRASRHAQPSSLTPSSPMPTRCACSVTTGEAGERLIDLGAKVVGRARSRPPARRSLHGRPRHRRAHASHRGSERWPLGVVVHSSNPVIACLASQYAGWTIQRRGNAASSRSARARPARCRASRSSTRSSATSTTTARRRWSSKATRPRRLRSPRKVAAACGVQPGRPHDPLRADRSLAGTVQIAARVLEVALHKAHALHFPLENIVDGIGTAPDRAAHPRFHQGHGPHQRRHHLRRPRAALRTRRGRGEPRSSPTDLPSSTCSAYGKPFAEIFAAVNGDFYKIDPMLFSPAAVIVSNLDTGSSFHAGELAPEIVDASFR